ncbi:methyltransferase, partial [Myxococcota bacterium]|nr:methyltransferase [Myxococcota bacterium]
MDQVDQVQAYAHANFEEPHGQFIDLLGQRLGPPRPLGRALDLGCGPGDITYRVAETRPLWSIEAIDGARAMIASAQQDP